MYKLILSSILLLFVVLSFAQVSEQKVIYVAIKGNTKTKPEIIFREIEFSNGDTLSFTDLKSKVENSKANLTRTQLFNYIEVDLDEKKDRIDVVFTFQERWYYWGYPILEHSERNLSSFIYHRDWSRVNYGVAFDWYNFRGRDEVLKFKTRLGFKEHYAVSYHKPGFGERRVDGLWVFADFFRQKKVINVIDDNLPVYWQDSDHYLRNILDLGFEYSYRPKINYVIEFGLKYYQYFFNASFYNDILNGELQPKYIVPKLGFKYDNRNSVVYPSSGLYANLRMATSIYGVKDFSNSVSFTGFVQKNTPIGKSRFLLRNELLGGKYFVDNDRKVLFDEMYNFYGGFFIRGYEYYYFPSDFVFGSRNTISWKALDLNLNILPGVLPKAFSKFYSAVYLEAFSDFAYSESIAYENIVNNNFDNKIAYSIGAGISIETYYDRLIQFHVAYNSCFKKFGIFAEFKTPIYKIY